MKKSNIYFITQCSVFCALMCILAPVTVSIGPVPITLGLFAVMITALTSDLKSCVTIISVYLAMGIFGFSVFSGAKCGIGVLLGPTGGYLWSYVICAFMICTLSKRFENKVLKIISCMAGFASCYFFGTLQYIFLSGNISVSNALKVCVYPFVIFDVTKAILAVFLSKEINIRLEKFLN